MQTLPFTLINYQQSECYLSQKSLNNLSTMGNRYHLMANTNLRDVIECVVFMLKLPLATVDTLLYLS